MVQNRDLPEMGMLELCFLRTIAASHLSLLFVNEKTEIVDKHKVAEITFNLYKIGMNISALAVVCRLESLFL